MAEHGGKLVAQALKSRGVDHLFTLSGGHLFSIYDGCKAEGIGLVDVRHEQTAAFAAEGIAKAEVELPAVPEAGEAQPAAGVEEAAALLAGAERPAIMAGTGLYWARGE